MKRTLRRTLLEQFIAIIVCLLILTATAIWGVRGLTQDWSIAVRGYERLREVYEIAAHLTTARTLAAIPGENLSRPLLELESAQTKLQIGRDEAAEAGEEPIPDVDVLAAKIAEARAGVLAAEQHHATIEPEVFSNVIGATVSSASAIRTTIQAAQRRADARQRLTVELVAGVAAALIAGAIGIGWWQYRSVMRPLNRLGDGVRAIAARDFSKPIPKTGHREFANLAGDFNNMAAQLDQLYHHLEQQVDEKSRELLRSRHLASLGFLAAGVAHEINNPLGIITAYAELTLQKLRDGGAASSEIEPTLRVICDEAFRCKAITEKLLSMANSRPAPRTRVDLSSVVAATIPQLQSLPAYQARAIAFTRNGKMPVNASEPEMKQVVLNLLTNALDALDQSAGRIDVALQRQVDQIELRVKDTGRGMSEATLQRAFEPFFTLPTESRCGTGLGLSIVRAIVDSHGGTVEAASTGVGCGSEFVVRLPRADERSS